MVALATMFIAIAPQINRTYFVKAGAEAGNAAGAGAGGAFAKGFDKSSAPMFSSMKSRFAGAANLLIPLGLAAGVQQIFKVGMAYEDSMNMMQAVTKASGAEMDAVGKKARELGADVTLPGVSAAGAADAMVELSKAGFSVQQSMDAAKGTLQLARIAGMSEAEAATVAANAVNAFGIEAGKTTMVVDELAAAANASSADIHDVDLAFRMASNAFSGFQGPTVGSEQAITELNTAIAILANNGIRGSDAGTSLKQMMLQLTGPTERASVVMEELAYIAGGANVSLAQQEAIMQGSKKVRDGTIQDIRDQNKAMGDMGNVAYTASGQMRSLPEIIDIMTKATKHMTAEQRNAAVTQVFGADATRSMIALMKGGLPAYKAMEQAVLRQAAAADLAAAKNKGLRGAIDNVRSQFENAAIEIYNQIKGPLTRSLNDLAKAMQDLPKHIEGFFTFLKNNSGVVKFFGKVITDVVLAIALYKAAVIGVIAVTKAWAAAQAIVAFVQLATQVRSLSDAWALMGAAMNRSTGRLGLARAELEKMGPAASRTSGALGKLGGAMGVIGAALGVLNLIGSSIGSSVNPQIDALTKGLQRLATGGKVAGESARVLGGDMDLLDQAVYDLGRTDAWSSFVRSAGGAFETVTGLGNAYDRSLQHSKERLAGVDQALQQMVQSGNGTQAAAIFQQIADRAAAQGVSVGRLKTLLPGYSAALEVAATAATNAGGGAKKLSDSLNWVGPPSQKAKDALDGVAGASKGVTGQVKEQIKTLKDLVSKTREQFDPAYAFIKAQQELKTAQKEATKAIQDHGAKSKAAREATLNLASAALNLNDKATALGDKFNGKLTPAMKEVFKRAHLSDSQIRILSKAMQGAKTDAEKLGAQKPHVKTDAPGLSDVDKRLKEAKRKADLLDGNYRVRLFTDGERQTANRLYNLNLMQLALKSGAKITIQNRRALAIATGGTVPGYSPNDTADNIPAYLTAGEFVQPVRTVKHYGTRFMEAVQKRKIPKEIAEQVAQYADGGPVRRYAAGGLIQLPFPVTTRMTRIPSAKEAAAAVAPPVPTGGRTDKWIISAARALVGAVRVISAFRPGARTLSGTRSYHSMGRAVDFAPSLKLARAWNIRYGRRTKEEITPWRQYDIHNGRAYHYSAALHAQHSGGNAHVHIAVAKGGLITADGKGLPVKLFDKGGWWPSGTMGMNLSGKSEYVSPGGDAPVQITINNYGAIGSQGELDDWLAKGLKRLQKQRRLP